MPCNAKNEGKEWPAGFNALYNVFPSQKFMEYWFSVNYYQNTLVFFFFFFFFPPRAEDRTKGLPLARQVLYH